MQNVKDCIKVFCWQFEFEYNSQMAACITEITLKSLKKSDQNYFKIITQDTYISKISHKHNIKQSLKLPISPTDTLCFQIWNYEPHKLVRSWNIHASHLFNSQNKYKMVDNQWSVAFRISEKYRGLSENKENIRHRAINSLSSLKDFKNEQKSKKHNKSRIKEINLLMLQKKKNKAGVKKALKSTIDYIIKQNNHEDYGLMEPKRAKTGKHTPSVQQISYIKNHNSLYSDYGFNNSELSKRYEEKELRSVDNEQNLGRRVQKKKIKIR